VKRWIPYAELVFATGVWGASFVATKIALGDVSPATVVWLRFAIGVIVLGIAVLLRKQFIVPSGRDLAYFALLGFIGITFHQWLQSRGLVTSQASTTAWIVTTIPIFMALLGWMFLREGLHWHQVLGISLAGLGVLLVVSRGDLQSLAPGKFGAPGDFLILLSAPNWAIFSILSRSGLRKYDTTRMTFMVMLLGWLFSFLIFLMDKGPQEIAQLTPAGWGGIGFLGVFCSGLAYIAWYDGLKHIKAAQAGVFLYIEPLVAMIVSSLLIAEPITWSAIIGGGVILAGVWLVQRIQV
jgi:drug/metabolite transporter (DMT)-like permease